MKKDKTKDSGTPGSVFKVGAIALAFLLIGYQAALFIHRAAALRIESLRDHPDTVYVVDESLALRLLSAERTRPGTHDALPDDFMPDDTPHDRIPKTSGNGRQLTIRHNAPHPERVEQVRRATRKVENFRFNPNTVSVEDLVRLGFTEKQARSIDNYRAKGGRFRRPSDFARSYVVSDSVFRRLEPWITIPRTDINRADSAAFDALPGIGPYFAAKMVSYRTRLGGYSYTEQLMDIHNFDEEKFKGLSDLVSCSPPPRPFRLWTLSADSLRLHPYIRNWQTARSIVLFRDNTPREGWTVQALADASILPPEDASRLARCAIAQP